MSESDEAIFRLGEAAKVFIQSDLGKYIDGISLQDIEEARDALMELDPYKFTELVALQNELSSIQRNARVAQKMREYLAETVERGKQAEHQLTHEE